MSDKRKPISKKLRFEIFKRDSFTCQYCGQKSPDVVLHVDHINPVSKGGDNDILNLITSCQGCNLGKGAREMSDTTELDRQRRQLEELNERRQQLEWMLKWRDELKGLDDAALEAACHAWARGASPYSVNGKGRKDLRLIIQKFGIEATISAIDIVTDQYIAYAEDGATQESVEAAFSKIGAVAYHITYPDKAASDKELYYIRGILRNRLDYVNEGLCMKLLREARDVGMCIDGAKDVAREATSWTKFREVIEGFIREYS